MAAKRTTHFHLELGSPPILMGTAGMAIYPFPRTKSSTQNKARQRRPTPAKSQDFRHF
jgi:hypothetical protein